MKWTEAYVTKNLKAIQRVRELHKEINGPADDTTCSACAFDEVNYPQYPCPTIQALDGNNDSSR